jgi:hypothetical protein
MMLSLQGTGFLLSELCTRHGLCLPPEARRHLLEQAPPDAESFTAAVFAAEGLERAPSDPDVYRDALALVRQAFADHARAHG